MPKPDQKISISAALQRPQRQKALPKPLAKNIETDLQPEIVTETAIAEEVKVSLEPTSKSPELELPKFTEPEVKKAIVDKTKPILKPKPKAQIQSEADPAIKDLNPEENIEISTVAEIQDEVSDPISEEEQYEDERSLDIDSEHKHTLNQVAESTPPIFWCQAVGLIEAKYLPNAEVFHKGELVTGNGTSYKAYVLSKAIKSLEKKIDLSLAHQFVVYPKTSKLNGIRFEILATDVSSKIEEFEDGQFNIRGFITKQLENSFLIEIQRRPEYLPPAQYDRFTLEVRGDIPLEIVQQFVYLKCQLTEDYLSVVSYEHLACPFTPKPPARLNKTEKPILKSKSVILAEITTVETVKNETIELDKDPTQNIDLSESE